MNGGCAACTNTQIWRLKGCRGRNLGEAGSIVAFWGGEGRGFSSIDPTSRTALVPPVGSLAGDMGKGRRRGGDCSTHGERGMYESETG